MFNDHAKLDLSQVGQLSPGSSWAVIVILFALVACGIFIGIGLGARMQAPPPARHAARMPLLCLAEPYLTGDPGPCLNVREPDSPYCLEHAKMARLAAEFEQHMREHPSDEHFN